MHSLSIIMFLLSAAAECQSKDRAFTYSRKHCGLVCKVMEEKFSFNIMANTYLKAVYASVCYV